MHCHVRVLQGSSKTPVTNSGMQRRAITYWMYRQHKLEAHCKVVLGFPGGSVVKNPPADAGDVGSVPGPGRSHMAWSR